MKQMNNEQKTGEAGRLARLIEKLDSRDRSLEPVKRRQKWMLLLVALFLLYLASFFLPVPGISHKRIDPKASGWREDSNGWPTPKPPGQKSLTFEMPVDSFENLLKQRIDESNPEKK
ncbi:hypothetical protein [Sunxiuqinia indica]|uniref:hypothetical protein n=1 Tax=Sunxiuqinia indica TaxID=2692584 RepID=UPI00135C1201|nr:hypothetical protein [Sunxiuqinia indica]